MGHWLDEGVIAVEFDAQLEVTLTQAEDGASEGVRKAWMTIADTVKKPGHDDDDNDAAGIRAAAPTLTPIVSVSTAPNVGQGRDAVDETRKRAAESVCYSASSASSTFTSSNSDEDDTEKASDAS